MPESYRHAVPKAGLSIEYCTEAVPQDGKYYLLQDGQVVDSFKTRRQAEQRLREMLAGINYTPDPVLSLTKTQAEIDVERFLDAKDMYWALSHKYKGRGGRGGRGGV